jgi:cytochrome P450
MVKGDLWQKQKRGNSRCKIQQKTMPFTAIIDKLLNQVAATDHMDIIDDLAYPLPVIVIAEMLGIPREDRERFKIWSDATVGASYPGGSHPQAEMRYVSIHSSKS